MSDRNELIEMNTTEQNEVTCRDLRSQVEYIAQQAIDSPDLRKLITKKVKEIGDQIEDELMYRLQSDASYNLGHFVQRISGKVIEAILAGDEGQLRNALNCKDGQWNGRDNPNPVIRCKIFESSTVELRRKIVDAYPDLLKSERILDLESQNRALIAQVNELESKFSRLQRESTFL